MGLLILLAQKELALAEFDYLRRNKQLEALSGLALVAGRILD